ncbi:MAG: Gfo/Idh/MocA family oxidoreductase [Smithellaceae bacterium]|nr:Gfo/Idh/MocA family oxidoreductase [Smithellaceae bacterium]
MKTVKVGVIGSQFAADFHLRNLSRLRGSKVEVLAVASRNKANAALFANKYQIPEYYDDYRRILERKDIDLVDLCVPTDLHESFSIEAAEAKKHIICEKPLTGYFGKDREEEHVGFTVKKQLMLDEARAGCDRVACAVKSGKVKFMYAENWVYAPPLLKLKNLIKATGGTILDIRAEGSHSGSHAPHARKWKTSGGGSIMRLGAHPVGAVLHLKHYEGILKCGAPIRPKSVTAEVGYHTKISSFTQEKKKYIVSNWEDVEDWGVMVINFTDESKATVFSSDAVLGGVKNTMSVYLSNAVVHVNINPHNVLEVYAPEAHIFGDEYIAEKLETKAGWNFPSPDEDWMRGFPQELEDFLDAILWDREPISGIDLAREVIEVIYAAYVSAEEGRRINLNELVKSRHSRVGGNPGSV